MITTSTKLLLLNKTEKQENVLEVTDLVASINFWERTKRAKAVLIEAVIFVSIYIYEAAFHSHEELYKNGSRKELVEWLGILICGTRYIKIVQGKRGNVTHRVLIWNDMEDFSDLAQEVMEAGGHRLVVYFSPSSLS